jgi:NhaP-type Na+/H+ or K+/H+ antiporter
MIVIFVVFLLLVFLFSLVSRRAQTSYFTGPMVFTLAGLLLSFALPQGASESTHDKTVLLVAEITLAIVLFSEATCLSLRKVMRESQLPARLLGIGMPLAIVLGTVVALVLLDDLGIWEAAILATILAPTDASLGSTVFKSPLVPARLRQALNVEGGLNDGLSIPLLMLFIALSGVTHHGEQQSWIVYTAQQIGFGLLVGIAIGWLGGWLMTRAELRGWTEEETKQLGLLALAILAWAVAEKIIGGNGFIAAFVAGGMMRLSFEEAHQHMAEFNESWGDLLIYLVFFIFGLMTGQELFKIGWQLWLFGLLALTLIRMLPVAIGMIGTKLRPASVLFLGWFGPRGLASVVLGLIYIEELEGFDVNPMILLSITATVLLSVFAHGISANPAIKALASRVGDLEPEAPEHQETVIGL